MATPQPSKFNSLRENNPLVTMLNMSICVPISADNCQPYQTIIDKSPILEKKVYLLCWETISIRVKREFLNEYVH